MTLAPNSLLRILLVVMLGFCSNPSAGQTLSQSADTWQGQNSNLWTDFNHDGEIQPAEIIQVLLWQLHRMPVADLDDDGVVSLSELKQQAFMFISTLAGDTNGDGIIDHIDVAEVVAETGQSASGPGVSSDMDLDGSVTFSDVIAVADATTTLNGQPTNISVDDAFAYVTSLVQAGISLGLPADPSVPSPLATDPNGPPGHAMVITSTWPGEHATNVSNSFWPPNHDGTISNSWDSNTNDDDIPDDFIHNELQSSRWPPNHSQFVSEDWDTTTGHWEGTSGQWPPSHFEHITNSYPTNHLASTSHAWPPNHHADESTLMQPSVHINMNSATWSHGIVESESLGWPANHNGLISQSWFDHSTETSETWPADHLHAISTMWPGDRNWPANHIPIVSRLHEIPNPDPGIPFWPPGHSVWRSALDLIPLLDSDVSN